jgi:hypothetical protein
MVAAQRNAFAVGMERLLPPPQRHQRLAEVEGDAVVGGVRHAPPLQQRQVVLLDPLGALLRRPGDTAVVTRVSCRTASCRMATDFRTNVSQHIRWRWEAFTKVSVLRPGDVPFVGLVDEELLDLLHGYGLPAACKPTSHLSSCQQCTCSDGFDIFNCRRLTLVVCDAVDGPLMDRVGVVPALLGADRCSTPGKRLTTLATGSASTGPRHCPRVHGRQGSVQDS